MTTELRKGSRLANYQLLLAVGRGGMASVWVARMLTARPEEDRLVAIKVMLSDLDEAEGDFVSMFVDEVRLVSAIRHPNVVKVYEASQQGGLMFMAMEWVEGESLQAIMQEAGKRRPIPPEMAVKIIADAAAGLHAAHELIGADGKPRGVVHRDISPHNILLSRAGAVKLVDFGIAKAVGRLTEATQIGQLKGKFSYMSPEQARGKSVDRRSDVFSLGIVLYELTTNRRLFKGKNEIDTLRLVLTCTVPRPSSVVAGYSPELERIVLKALAPTPESRYQTADALKDDLEDFLKRERIVVTASGLAGLLKRVLGERIEARRQAVRDVLIELGSERQAHPSLLSPDPAFTPTGPGAPATPWEHSQPGVEAHGDSQVAGRTGRRLREQLARVQAQPRHVAIIGATLVLAVASLLALFIAHSTAGAAGNVPQSKGHPSAVDLAAE
ncbi:MAG: serine/threonine-protein kinase [Polyangiaceae bacterium]|nr:serine/threonine-protein kinase [Polyangiaceae bacterium]